MKQKFKSYNFWLSLTSVAILFIRLIGARFGFTINENEFMDIMVVLCTIFVVLGIFEVPKTSTTVSKSQEGVTMIDESLLSVMDISKQIKEDMVTNLNEIEGVVQDENKIDAPQTDTKNFTNEETNKVGDEAESVVENISNSQDLTAISVEIFSCEKNEVFDDVLKSTSTENIALNVETDNVENMQNVAEKTENIVKNEENVVNIEENTILNETIDGLKNKEISIANVQNEDSVDCEKTENLELETGANNAQINENNISTIETQIEKEIDTESVDEDALNVKQEEVSKEQIEETQLSSTDTTVVNSNVINSQKEQIVCYDYTLTEEDIENILHDYEKQVELGEVTCSEDYIIMIQDKIKRSHEKDFIN